VVPIDDSVAGDEEPIDFERETAAITVSDERAA
jgi:hypothetical protein